MIEYHDFKSAYDEYIEAMQNAARAMLEFSEGIKRIQQTREFRQWDMYDRYFSPLRSDN
jgi:hypothetical protein